MAEAYATAGADLVELGVPYSDPLADGVVIHTAATRALAAGATLDSVLSDCERIAARVPVVPMAYANMILARGPERFAGGAGRSRRRRGDRPRPAARGERRDRGRAAGRGAGPDPAGRTDDPGGAPPRICAAAEGFVYLVSDTRTTGERDRLPEALGDLIAATQADRRGPGRGRLRHRHARAGGQGRGDRGRRHRRHPAGPRGRGGRRAGRRGRRRDRVPDRRTGRA